ncbi:MAG: alkaline phosphatase D family protein [Actinomycetota bacterium]
MRFPYGVASGDVSHDSVVLWVKTEPGTTVEWRCGETQGTAVSDAKTGSVHVPVTGLEPGLRYSYSFSAGGESIDAVFKTIPIDRTVRFAVICCAKYNSGFFNAYRAIADMDDIDFVLELGDYIYEAAEVPTGKQTPGANIGRPMDPLNNCVSYEDYDTRYALYRTDKDLLALHARHAIIATIDDHELSDNAWEGGADEHDPATQGPWADRVRGAMTAWSDWMPTMRRPQDGDHVWREIDLGVAGRILLCETRLKRSDPNAPQGETKTALGLEQRAFMLDRLAAGGDGWTFLAVPSMLSDLDHAMGDDEALFALHKLKLAESDSPKDFHDLWDSFEWEQDGLIDGVARLPRGVALSGDVHFSAEFVSWRDAGVFDEWTVTSITSPNLDDKMGWPRGAESLDYEAALLRNLPDLRWCDLDSHGFLVVEADLQFAACQWWFVDQVRAISDDFTMGHSVALPAHPEGTVA